MGEIRRVYNENGHALTCPQCGATIEGTKCKYCGALFIDFACLDADKPFYLKVKKNDIIHIFKVRLALIKQETEFSELYYDNRPYQVCPYTSLTMDFDVLPNDFVEKEVLES